MTYVPTKEIKIKERQDKFLKAQLEKEREQALLEEIEKTEKERVKKKGLKVLKSSGILDAYQGLLVSLCKYGLPTEDLYEFSALTVLKHEKKLKALKKKELEERLKKRNDEKQLNPIRARAVSNNPGGAAAQGDQNQAAGVSPQPKNRLGSKRRVIGASSVERPQAGQQPGSLANQRGSLPGAKDGKRSKNGKGAAGGEDTGEDGHSANPFTAEDDEGSVGARRKERKQKRARREEQQEGGGDQQEQPEEETKDAKKKRRRNKEQAPAEEDDAMAEEPVRAKSKKKRRRDGSVEEAAPEEEEPRRKKKKRARDSAAAEEDLEQAEADGDEEPAPRKKKKKSKRNEEADQD